MHRAFNPATGRFDTDLGRGLFARRDLATNTLVAQFQGTPIDTAVMQSRTSAGRGGYMIKISHATILDCYQQAQDGICKTSMANDPRHTQHVTSLHRGLANVKMLVGLTRSGWRVALHSTTALREGTEILLHYSDEFRFPTPPAAAAPANAGDGPPRPPTAATVLPHASLPTAAGNTTGNPTATSPSSAGTCSAQPDHATLRNILVFKERTRLAHLPVLSDDDTMMIRDSAHITNRCLRLLQPGGNITDKEILALLTDAHVAASNLYGVRAAQEVGNGFTFPPEVLLHDANMLREHNYDMAALARTRHAELLPNRLSVARIVSCFGTTNDYHLLSMEDFARLIHIGSAGVRIFRPPSFRPHPTPAPLRTRYEAVSPTIHMLQHKQWLEGKVVVVPLAAAQRVQGVHLQNCQHWTTNKGKPAGRAITDFSACSPESPSSLNGSLPGEKAVVAARYTAFYGQLHHPTLTSIMHLIIAACDKWGAPNIQLWKKDLRDAFGLLWTAPEDIPLIGIPLTEERVLFSLCASFGLGGLPPAFGVITRAVLALVGASTTGYSSMYVDDLFGASPTDHIAADMAAADYAIKKLLGPEAVAAHKDESGRAIDIIGWHIDLDRQTVTVSRSNLLRALHAFFCFQLEDAVSRTHVERMASLASRLSMLHSYMRPYTRQLNVEAAMFPTNNPLARHHLSSLAQCDTAMFRAFLIIMHCSSTAMARPFHTFRREAPRVVIEYDASLYMAGAGLSELDPLTGRRTLLRYVSHGFPFQHTDDSSFQNTSEYIATLIGLLLAHSLGLHDFSYILMGDNITSLQWSRKQVVKSTFARRANIAVAILSSVLAAQVHQVIHVPGVDNVRYDGLSRGKSAQDLGLDPALQYHADDSTPLARCVALCDPRNPLTTADAHMQLSAELLRILRPL